MISARTKHYNEWLIIWKSHKVYTFPLFLKFLYSSLTMVQKGIQTCG